MVTFVVLLKSQSPDSIHEQHLELATSGKILAESDTLANSKDESACASRFLL